ncbi:protein tyrosine/serine phosphatase [Treponema primitia ZAS-2]|uniref:Protein tyrosine/serine phosphatase n=1 Tax=Treponema primitia (strain ATCC BAA-887 / DSM 12427 / ZAS-2) TaxID=545694 RepID=F5YMV6_TREPZ|nr:tyrosine-protein phosphatase [Treponema primitia]AEF85531.1 protein tyrosine/serine phosphatase [Treponema primitia ZAS-2]
MKMTKLAHFFVPLTAVLTLFAACYQEVEVDDYSPGSLARIAGAYNFRDVGGYTTFNNTLFAGQILQAYQESGEALGAFQAAIQVEAPKLATVDALTAAGAIQTAWTALKNALPSYEQTLGALNLVTDLVDNPSNPDNVSNIALKLGTIAGQEWGKVQAAFPEPEYGLSAITATDRAAISAALGKVAANMNPKRIKRGVLYRSGDLSRLTDRDIKYIGGLGIQAVIDFRGITPQSGNRAAERSGEDLDRVIPGALMGQDLDPYPITDYPKVGAAISTGLEGKFGNRFAIEEGVIGSMAEYLGPDKASVNTAQVMIDGYRNFMEKEAKLTSDISAFGGSKPYEASGRQQMHNFFMYLIYKDGAPNDSDPANFRNAPVPVIAHCSAGKDRTGIATALFYSALGIPRETIISDYMLSAQYVAEKYTPVVNVLGAQLEPLVSVRREYIDSMFKYIDDTFPANRWETASDETSALKEQIATMAANPPFNGYGLGASIAAAGYLYGTKSAEAGKNIFPNAAYDKSAAVIKFLTEPLAKTTFYTYSYTGNVITGTPVTHNGGLGLTPQEIYQLRKLYLE